MRAGDARSGAVLLDVSDDEVPQAHADVPAFAFPGKSQRDFALGDDRSRARLHDPGVGLGRAVATVQLTDIVDLGELAVALDPEPAAGQPAALVPDRHRR